jgi:hypothetical protein
MCNNVSTFLSYDNGTLSIIGGPSNCAKFSLDYPFQWEYFLTFLIPKTQQPNLYPFRGNHQKEFPEGANIKAFKVLLRAPGGF